MQTTEDSNNFLDKPTINDSPNVSPKPHMQIVEPYGVKLHTDTSIVEFTDCPLRELR